MVSRTILIIVCLFHIALSIAAVNHWVVNDNGKILQKIDSPFYMREPNNLIAFLDQIKYNDVVESTYLELLRQREKMAEQINFSIQFGMEIIDQAKCALDYYVIEKQISSTKITKDYLKRINLKNSKKKSPALPEMGIPKSSPFCWEYTSLNVGICCYDHLEGLKGTYTLQIEPEEELTTNELDFKSKRFVQTLIDGLTESPTSWKYHTLSSYYWRMQGDGTQAVECAKRAVMLAPRKVRDIPLLSLGIILYRAGKLRDAEVVLSAAVDHAPEVAENHFALGTTLAMIHEFNRSLTHFDTAEKLDPSFIPRTLPLKNFISCVENLIRKTSKMYSYAEYIKSEVSGLKSMKTLITQSHEKLIQQQVPLGARFFDAKTPNDELLHRGQYCSTRTLAGTDEPVLFCDFYSDLQMKLESKEVDIESLERELKANSDAIIKQLSSEFHTQFDFNNSPPSAVTTTTKGK
ncbi:tetratricopeptide repeat protein 17 [Episyrphus balteatus]|uniref:tetratricopeptide repeat protein 17 n=1 Tax=Episyrphus balteatus TaxID=286459 RepID=UPI0024850EBB|nr:tetratricopeptide repeat protein 17 [Episyrphus balteatus]